MYKLLIVDDEPLVRRGIKSLVDFSQLNISEVYEAANGEEAKKMQFGESPKRYKERVKFGDETIQ